ncbi:MAG: ATP-binding cassette domain-containing protein [Fulvivirga sp.]|mgnify:FL=1
MIGFHIKKRLNTSLGETQFQFDFEIQKESFTAIYGESGAGKTSLLRMISGLMKPDDGTITYNGKVWFDQKKNIDLHTGQRKVGFVFQDYALFPNMTVLGNLKFALSKSADPVIIDSVIDITDLGELKSKMPDTLSGGQQQRVALARAIVQQPELLLLDEPLSALDTVMQQKLQDYLIKVHKEFKLTTIFVTHDITQIIKMADQVMILESGKVVKAGKPTVIFGQSLSGKFKLSGRVLDIYAEGVINIASILIGKDVIKVVISGTDPLSIGDEVVVASKAFNPIVQKVGE